MTIRTLLLALPVLMPVSAPAFAQAVSEEDRAAIAARIETYESLMRAGDAVGLSDQMPPSVFRFMAARMGRSVDELRAAIRAQADTQGEALEAVSTVQGFEINLGAATFQMTPDGSRLHGLMPTEMVIADDEFGMTGRVVSQAVALEEDGAWYIVQIDTAEHAAFLRAVYPDFAGVTFTPSAIAPAP